MGILQHGAAVQMLGPCPLEHVLVDAAQTADLGLHRIAQRRPVEAGFANAPAIAARILEDVGEMAGIDEQLLRHAAADDAGAAIAIFLGNADPGAGPGRHPRRPHPARAAADDEKIVVESHALLDFQRISYCHHRARQSERNVKSCGMSLTMPASPSAGR